MSSFERELQRLLNLHGQAEQAAATLMAKYKDQKLSQEQLRTFSVFCLRAHLPLHFLDFLKNQIPLGAIIPWPQTLEAFRLAGGQLDEALWDAFIKGAKEQKAELELAKSHALDVGRPEILQIRDLRRKQKKEHPLELRRELLERVEMYRSQELDEQEGQTLRDLRAYFPRDPEIADLMDQFEARRAMQLLEERIRKPRERDPVAEASIPRTPDEEKSLQDLVAAMRETWRRNLNVESLPEDFAIACVMLEAAEEALEFVPQGSKRANWMRAELLLTSRRYAELLTLLESLEKQESHHPDGLLGVAYMRAQALWGLQRSHEAIELMSGLVDARPDFRSSQSLLTIWKGARP